MRAAGRLQFAVLLVCVLATVGCDSQSPERPNQILVFGTPLDTTSYESLEAAHKSIHSAVLEHHVSLNSWDVTPDELEDECERIVLESQMDPKWLEDMWEGERIQAAFMVDYHRGHFQRAEAAAILCERLAKVVPQILETDADAQAAGVSVLVELMPTLEAAKRQLQHVAGTPASIGMFRDKAMHRILWRRTCRSIVRSHVCIAESVDPCVEEVCAKLLQDGHIKFSDAAKEASYAAYLAGSGD